MRHMMIGLGALSLLAVSPAFAQDSNSKMNDSTQKSSTKMSSDGTKLTKHTEASKTTDGEDGKVVTSGSTDAKMKTNADGSTDKMTSTDKKVSGKGAAVQGRRKVTKKTSKDANGNVTHDETTVKQK